jgi:hypothetical protein
MQPETDLEKFKRLFREVGIEFFSRDLLSGNTELCVKEDDKCTILAVFDTLTGKYIEFEAY